MANTLALGALLALATSGLYLYIGSVVAQRKVSAEARLARDLFAAWWFILGVSGMMGVVQVVLYMGGRLPIWLYLTFSQLALLWIFVALWALQCYLMYLYRGSHRALIPLGVFYLLLYVFIVGLLMWLMQEHPYTGITDNGWMLVAEPKYEIGRGVGLIAVLVLIGPQMVAAGAYLRLYTKANDRTQRYRIALLSGAILGWFGTSLSATAADASEGQTWQLVSRLIGLAAGAIILAAYKPPRWIRQRYSIRGINDPGEMAAP
jgi:hypothetical protein